MLSLHCVLLPQTIENPHYITTYNNPMPAQQNASIRHGCSFCPEVITPPEYKVPINK